jgi:hypothetical protein
VKLKQIYQKVDWVGRMNRRCVLRWTRKGYVLVVNVAVTSTYNSRTTHGGKYRGGGGGTGRGGKLASIVPAPQLLEKVYICNN